MKEAFIERTFKAETRVIIEQANAIIDDYQARGFKLTLRQLYYQFVARALIPNKQSEYKRLGSIVNDGRLAGLIDWAAIEDRTRNLESPSTWASPESILSAVASQYREDAWAGQGCRPEVWIEKEALIGVVEGVCEELRVPYFACRGYSSQSESYAAGVRFRGYIRKGQIPIVLHLGDHDPSGIDMTRDNTDRLVLFAESSAVVVKRLALNMPQIERYRPPPNPAKDTDARFAGYQALYGDESWELDALDPDVIAALIRDAVGAVRDQAAWDRSVEAEERNRETLSACSDRWDEVKIYLDD